MKTLSLALACGLVLTACGGGGSDDTPVAAAANPPAAIAGMWQATSVFDSTGTYQLTTLPAGSLYVMVDNVEENPVDVTRYTVSETDNCFDVEHRSVTHIGNNQYKSTTGEVGTITATADKLSMSVVENGLTVSVSMDRDTTTSVADLQLCTQDSEAGTQDDQPSDAFVTRVFSYLNQ